MFVQQISVFVENKKGRLADITKILSDNAIDISAISIADTTNFGILRMIVNNPQKAVKVIHDNGYTVNSTDVFAVEILDKPGGLNNVLEVLDQHNISIEYLYSFIRKPSESALILFRVEEPERAVDILSNNDIKVLTQEEVYNL